MKNLPPIVITEEHAREIDARINKGIRREGFDRPTPEPWIRWARYSKYMKGNHGIIMRALAHYFGYLGKDDENDLRPLLHYVKIEQKKINEGKCI